MYTKKKIGERRHTQKNEKIHDIEGEKEERLSSTTKVKKKSITFGEDRMRQQSEETEEEKNKISSKPHYRQRRLRGVGS